jgi:hypothetical protein
MTLIIWYLELMAIPPWTKWRIWRRSVKRFWIYHICCVLASYQVPITISVGIQKNSVLSKMTPGVWGRYLKRFKSYSIFKCWSSEIQDVGRRPKWRNFSTSLDRSISIVTRYICVKGNVCSLCSFVTIHIVTSIHTSIDSITQIHS